MSPNKKKHLKIFSNLQDHIFAILNDMASIKLGWLFRLFCSSQQCRYFSLPRQYQNMKKVCKDLQRLYWFMILEDLQYV